MQLSHPPMIHPTDDLVRLFTRYRTALYTFAYRFVGNRETAEDIVQETFIRCLKHRRQIPTIRYISTWLFTITGNLAKSELRRHKRRQWVAIDPGDGDNDYYFEPLDEAPLPDVQSENSASRKIILDAIKALPEEFRQSVALRDVQGFSYEEIAQMTERPLGTVKSRVNRGRRILQQQLAWLATELFGAEHDEDLELNLSTSIAV